MAYGFKKTKLALAMGAVMSVALAGSAVHADSIDPLVLDPTTGHGQMFEFAVTGGFEYVVDMKITGGNSIVPGDSFAIFAPAAATVSAPTSFTGLWTGSVSHTTYNPTDSFSHDTLNDVLFTYNTGNPPMGSAAPQDLGIFTFFSTTQLSTIIPSTVVNTASVQQVFGGAIYDPTPAPPDTGFNPNSASSNSITWDLLAGSGNPPSTPLPAAFGPGVVLLGGLAFLGKRRMSKAAV